MHQYTAPILESRWHHLIPPRYRIPSKIVTLSPEQTSNLIQSQILPSPHQYFHEHQLTEIEGQIEKSKTKCLIAKVNGRMPIDLSHVEMRKIKKAADLLEMITTSEFLMDGMDQSQQNVVLLRHFSKALTQRTNYYEVIVINGNAVGVAQKYCDHLGTKPNPESLSQLCQGAKTVYECLEKQEGPKDLIVSLFTKNNICKVSSIKHYHPQYPPHPFKPNEISSYEGVKPVVKVIECEEDLVEDDVRNYLAGNELNDMEKVNEWKEFMEEAKNIWKQ